MDATRGLGDYADDLAAVIDALELPSVHLVGWSMGGGAVLQYLTERPATRPHIDQPERFIAALSEHLAQA